MINMFSQMACFAILFFFMSCPGAQGSAISAFNLGLSGSGGSNRNICIKGLPAVLERMGWLVCSTGFTKQCHLCP